MAVQQEKRELAALRQERMAREREEAHEKVRLEALAKNEHIQAVKMQLDDILENRKREIMARQHMQEEKMKIMNERREEELEEKNRIEKIKMERSELQRRQHAEKVETERARIIARQAEKAERTDVMRQNREYFVKRLTNTKDDHAK